MREHFQRKHTKLGGFLPDKGKGSWFSIESNDTLEQLDLSCSWKHHVNENHCKWLGSLCGAEAHLLASSLAFM